MKKKSVIILFSLLVDVNCSAQLQDAFVTSASPTLTESFGAAYVNIASYNWRSFQKNFNSSFNWNALDRDVKYYQLNGIDIYFTIQSVSPTEFPQTPCAANYSNAKGIYQSWFPEDTVKWKIFLDSLVERYDKNGVKDMPELQRAITHWHIEQEWPRIWCSQFPDTSLAFAEEFVKYEKMTYRELKRMQPNSVISFGGIDTRHEPEAFYDGFPNQQSMCISSDCATQNNITKAQLSSNAKFLADRRNVLYLFENAQYDELDIHHYGRWETIPDVVQWIKTKVPLVNKRIVFLEGGGPFCKACEPIYHSASDTSGYLPPELVRDNASYVVYYYIVGIANGVKRIHWHLLPEYNIWGATFGDLDLVTKSFAKKPSYYTYRYLANLVKASNADTIVNIPTGNFALYFYKIDPMGVSVIWSLKENDTLKVSAEGRLFISHIPTVLGDSLIHVDTLNAHGLASIILRDKVPVFISGVNFIISQVEPFNQDNEERFELFQNFPNPFNPTTTIEFSVPSLSRDLGLNNKVVIKVYDILGREVATLVEEEKSAGKYAVKFDASNLPSGIYFYRLTTGNFSQARKLTLLK